MRRLIMLGLIGALLTACGGPPPAEQIESGGVIQWERDPQTIVFRADVVGGAAAERFRTRNDVPLCTIYGDNRIVWINDLGDFRTQVLWDRLTDAQIESFITYLTVAERIFTYEAAADLQTSAGNSAPVVEQMTIQVNGQRHVTDSFGGWDINYFQDIVDVCHSISQGPVLYEPTDGAWVSVRATTYNSNVPTVIWEDTDDSPLSLRRLSDSGEREWVDGQVVSVLWNLFRTSSPNLHFLEGDQMYRVALEVPGVTRDAPPPPDGV
jgi:hypothetical protein